MAAPEFHVVGDALVDVIASGLTRMPAWDGDADASSIDVKIGRQFPGSRPFCQDHGSLTHIQVRDCTLGSVQAHGAFLKPPPHSKPHRRTPSYPTGARQQGVGTRAAIPSGTPCFGRTRHGS